MEREQKIARLQELMDIFTRNIRQYKNPNYDEANTRTDFVDKFFELLDWDVRNEQGYSEDYREVVREDKIQIAGKPKAPDYGFKIGKERKFFVEVKRPSVGIKDDPSAHQLRSYAYSAKLPLSILTDFEEFAIYDTRTRPKPSDKAGVDRIFYCDYKEYIKNFDYIYDKFSKPAILKGSFDKYVSERKDKRGTMDVDSGFLSLIEEWRKDLAQKIALRNKQLDVYSLNYAVQKIIDRIIFLRIAEDRNIEEYESLKKITEQEGIYPRLDQWFERANRKYNSELFKSEEFLSRLAIDDAAIKGIIKSLYYPDCPYILSVMPLETLGNIYEQFLGKVIHLTPTHQARVEAKPEVRKAHGVYYTPKYIVDYIVENTVGELLKGKNPEQISALRVLDPACGSGSFLVGAYTRLLEYHLNYYLEAKNSKKALKESRIYQYSADTCRLTIEEKQRILLNNIYGVDIDPQAVEVTKLSLMLKLLENESIESAGEIFRHSDLKLLPDLSSNIKCGNSLIGSDFYKDKNLSLFDKEEMRKINAFDWEKEFAEIMADGGFDAVVGNPPYVRQEGLGVWKEYFKYHYKTYAGTADLYTYFIEKSLTILKKHGYFGYIVSNKWMRANYGRELRKFIKQFQTEQLIDFGELNVFKNVTAYPMIIIINKSEKKDRPFYAPIKRLDFQDLTEEVKSIGYYLEEKTLSDNGFSMVEQTHQNVIDKIKTKGVPLKKYVHGKTNRGIVSGLNKAFIIDESIKERLEKEDTQSEEIIKPFVNGADIRRYKIIFRGKFLIFTRHGIDIDKYPAIKTYLSQWKDELTPKKTGKEQIGRKPGSYKWYEIQDTIDYYKEFEKPKIIWPENAEINSFAFSNEPLYINKTCFFLPSSDLYLLGILNSKLIWLFIKSICDKIRGGWYAQQGIFINQLPIRTINFSDAADRARHDRMVALVEDMLSTQKQLHSAKTEADQKTYQQKTDLLDRQIDHLVYELYGLTEEEIKVVEGEK